LAISEEQKEEYLQSVAVYGIHWKKGDGNRCFVEKQFTTSSRIEQLRSIRSDGKTFAGESTRVASGNVKATGDGPIATAMRTCEQVIVTAEDPKKMVRNTIAASFNMQKIRFVPLADGTVLEYGTPGSNAQKESFMQRLGATYGLHWVREGSQFVAKRDFTTAARIKAMRQVRGDDKLFATESAKYRLPADADGPVAYAVRSGREQVMEKDDLRKMKRWPIIKEFGIKKIHMIPMEDGSVLEYGTPSGEEVALLELLGLLVQEMLLIRTLVSKSGLWKLFTVSLETLSVLRLIAATEGPLKVMSGIRKAVSASFESVLVLERKLAEEARKGVAVKIRRVKVTRRLMQPLAAGITMATFFKEWVDSKTKEMRKEKQALPATA